MSPCDPKAPCVTGKSSEPVIPHSTIVPSGAICILLPYSALLPPKYVEKTRLAPSGAIRETNASRQNWNPVTQSVDESRGSTSGKSRVRVEPTTSTLPSGPKHTSSTSSRRSPLPPKKLAHSSPGSITSGRLDECPATSTPTLPLSRRTYADATGTRSPSWVSSQLRGGAWCHVPSGVDNTKRPSRPT